MHIYTSTIQHTLMRSVVVVQVAAARDRERPDASAGPLFPNRPPKPELAKVGEGDVANVLKMQRQARQEAKARGRGRGKGRGRGGRGRGKATAEQPMPLKRKNMTRN